MYQIKEVKTPVKLDYIEPKVVLNPNQDLYSGFQQMSFKKVKDGLQSSNFKLSNKGWKIYNTGNVEFNNGIFRGSLEANSIDIPNTTTANSFHADNTGNTWWGATTLATAPARVTKAGAGTFTNLTATGTFTITGGSGIASLSDAGVLATLNTVGTAQIDALAVNDTKIASNAITVAKIASSAVTQAKIATGAVGSNELSAGAVIAGKITAGTIVSADIATGTITAGNIATGTITATNIAAGAITSSKISVSQLSAISADIGVVTAGTITGTIITGGTIQTASSGKRIVMDGATNKLKVYDSSNNNILTLADASTNGSIIAINQPVDASDTNPGIYIVSSKAHVPFWLINNNTTSAWGSMIIDDYGTGSALTVQKTSSDGNCIYIVQQTNARSLVADSRGGTTKGMGIASFVQRNDAINTTGGALFVSQGGTSSIIDTNVAGCYLSNAGVWTNASSKKLKENFRQVKTLDKIMKLDIPEYNYISENIKTISKAKTFIKERQKDVKDIDKEAQKLVEVEKNKPLYKHITPLAEDFYKMFGLGDSKGISPADIAGVALQAIKELNIKVETLEKIIKNLK